MLFAECRRAPVRLPVANGEYSIGRFAGLPASLSASDNQIWENLGRLAQRENAKHKERSEPDTTIIAFLLAFDGMQGRAWQLDNDCKKSLDPCIFKHFRWKVASGLASACAEMCYVLAGYQEEEENAKVGFTVHTWIPATKIPTPEEQWHPADSLRTEQVGG